MGEGKLLFYRESEERPAAVADGLGLLCAGRSILATYNYLWPGGQSRKKTEIRVELSERRVQVKIGGIILFLAAVGLFAMGSGKQGLDASVWYVGAALAAACGGLLFALASKRSATPEVQTEVQPELEAEPETRGLGEGSRLMGVFFEPAKTFEDVAARPGFWAPLILVIAVSLCYMALFGQHVGWDRMVRHQIETSSRAAQLSPEQRETQIQMSAKFAPIAAYPGILLGVPLGTLVWAAVLLGIVKGLMSAQVRLKQVFAILCYSSLPGVIMALLAVAVMFMKPPEDFNLANPLVFNPGAFMDPMTTSKFVYSLASALDLFSLWKLALVAIGLKAAGGKLLSMGGAITAVFLPWAIWTLGAASLAGAFGR
jgi:hypothetical protein